MAEKIHDCASSGESCKNKKKIKNENRLKAYGFRVPDEQFKRLFQKYFRETILIFLHSYLFSRIMRGYCYE